MEIPSDVQSEIEDRVRSAKYDSVSAVFRRMLDGLRLIEEEDEKIRRNIRRGIEQYERGEVIPAEQVIAALRERNAAARARMK